MSTRPPDERSRWFGPTPASAGDARRFVVAELEARGRDDVVEAAALCTAELAANALLHTRAGFEVFVDASPALVRIDVRDTRPGELPIALPPAGSASAIIDVSLTGRGLRLVAETASRWGVETTAAMKTVWVELGGPRLGDGEPVMDLPPPAVPDAEVVVQLYGMPVRAAVGSGLQVDGLVRELQLGLFDDTVDVGLRSRFYDLLDRSAAARLAGRRAALNAAGRGEERFDLAYGVSAAIVGSLGALGELLIALPDQAPMTEAAPSDVVLAYRAWLEGEVARQLAGEPPLPCPLPA